MATENKSEFWERVQGWATILLGPWAFFRFGMNQVTGEVWEIVKTQFADKYGMAKEAYYKAMVGPAVRSLQFLAVIGNPLLIFIAWWERHRAAEAYYALHGKDLQGADWFVTASGIACAVISVLFFVYSMHQRAAQYIPLRHVGGAHDGEIQTDADGNTVYADNHPARFNLPLIILAEAIGELILSALLITCGALENDRVLVGLAVLPLAYVFVIVWVAVSLSSKAIEVASEILENVVGQIAKMSLPGLPNLTSDEAQAMVNGWLKRVSSATKITPKVIGLMTSLAVPIIVTYALVFLWPSHMMLTVVGGSVFGLYLFAVARIWTGGAQKVKDRTEKFVDFLFSYVAPLLPITILWGLLSDKRMENHEIDQKDVVDFIPSQWASFKSSFARLECGNADQNWWMGILNIGITVVLIIAFLKLTAFWSKISTYFETRWHKSGWFGKTLAFVGGKLLVVGYLSAFVFVGWWTGITWMSTRSLVNKDGFAQVCFGERPDLNPSRPINITATAAGQKILETDKPSKAEPDKASESSKIKSKVAMPEVTEVKLDSSAKPEIQEPPQWQKSSPKTTAPAKVHSKTTSDTSEDESPIGREDPAFALALKQRGLRK